MKIVLASRNQGKLREIRELLDGLGIEFVSLADIDHPPEVVEDGETFYANALKKAQTIAEYAHCPALADDSGLEVEALRGAPGIHSARYAGPGADDLGNIEKLLRDLEGVPPERRRAAFRCVLVLCHPDGRHQAFEGRWEGRISEVMRGRRGFGYDPVFYLDGEGKTVAELSVEEKNRRSHRAQAIRQLKRHLEAVRGAQGTKNDGA
ncbi:MAG TPA: XTP/dITP diphosphatase [Syntrophales bacterium]|nr:XTP/dITP diphosphatase [Syntrophales bacterium]